MQWDYVQTIRWVRMTETARETINKQKPRPWPGFLVWRKGPNYMAATKSGTMIAAFSCSNWVMRAAMPVYI